MRQIKEILRLQHEHHLSVREIARSCGLSSSTVGDYLQRAQAAGLSWPQAEALDETALLDQLMGQPTPITPAEPERPLPDWPRLHQELQRKGVTLQLLWEEYRQVHAQGYGYSRFCELYQRWSGTLDPVLRQCHVPGEKMLVDWAGMTVPLVQIGDAPVAKAHLFVAVLGGSNKTFAQAFPNEQLDHWINAHVQAYAFFGGVAKQTVPDNTKTAVTRACRYDPLLNRSYQEMAAHYGTAIVPARPRRPRDKAQGEGAVLIAERRILAALRDQRFFTVEELNQALNPLLARINAQPFQKLPGSRDQWFEEHEKSQLLALPTTPFELAYWSQAKANIDYHVAVDKHYYSVPYTLIHQVLDVRLTARTVELFAQGQRVASHLRSHQPGQCTTVAEHRPKSHQKHLEWTPGRIVAWAEKTGPACAAVVQQILASKPHPEQGYRSCLGVIRLGKNGGEARLEAACARALHYGTCSYKSIQSILQKRLEQQPLEPELPLSSPAHDNLRGGSYYI